MSNCKKTGFLKLNSFVIVMILFLLPGALYAQTYSLEQVVDYAQNYSPEAMKNKTSKENKYWQWKTYKSNYKPQLVLNSTLPAYQNNNIPVFFTGRWKHYLPECKP